MDNANGKKIFADELPADCSRFVELDKKKAEYKAFLEEYKTAVRDLVANHGIGTAFQDEEGTVYRIDTQDGRYVHYEPFVVNRTRREGEKKGSLALKEAEALGFALPEKS